MAKIVTLIAAAILFAVGPSLAPLGAQTASDTLRLDELAREAARTFAEARAGAEPVQTQPTVPLSEPGAPLPLTLDDAVQRAMERNLDISVERLNPQTFDFSISALRANYRPTFTQSLGVRSQTSLSRSQTAGGAVLVTDTLSGNTGIAQNVMWGGGNFQLGFTNNRQEQSDIFAIRNPAISSNLTAQYTQPLLRNFRIDGTRSQLQITQLNRDVSEIALRATIVRTLSNVRNAYWDLVFAREAEDVAQGSLALATKLVEDNQARVEVGTLAPLDVVQAQAEEANRRQAVTQAVATRRTAELSLKRLIVDGTEDPYWLGQIIPTDRPTYSTEPLDVQGAVRTALENRTDLQQQRRQLDSTNISMRSLSDQRLPALDLQASYALAGVGGPTIQRAGLGGDILDTIPGGYSDALRGISGREAPTWNVQLNFSYPIGTSSADANLARARVEQRQTIARSRALELQIATEVTNAALQVESNQERLQAATVARSLAEQRLQAEESRFEVGLSTNFFVVQAQRDLRDAQNSELRALLDYRRAQVDFERVQQIP